MKMSEGVEWALHCCLNLALLEPGQAVTAARLAAFHDLPAAYLNKQLQALARAGMSFIHRPKSSYVRRFNCPARGGWKLIPNRP